jgi:hypothetical protein
MVFLRIAISYKLGLILLKSGFNSLFISLFLPLTIRNWLNLLMALSLSQDLVPLFEDYFLLGPYRNIDLCLTQIFGTVPPPQELKTRK